MKLSFGKIIKIILALVLAAALVLLALHTWDNYRLSKDNNEARELMELRTPAPAPSDTPEPAETAAPQATPAPTQRPITDETTLALMQMDLAPLKEVNEEVIGWVHIPETEIDYPLLQREDNEHYLHHTWKNTRSAGGAIFMEHLNAPDMTDFNTIIYGHNMVNSAMFGGLNKYRNLKYLQEHPRAYVVTESGVYCYDIFAAHKVGIKTIMYRTQLLEPVQREEFIYFAIDYSAVDTGIIPSVEDKILTLSTCSSGSESRWVVQGVLNEERSYVFQ